MTHRVEDGMVAELNPGRTFLMSLAFILILAPCSSALGQWTEWRGSGGHSATELEKGPDVGYLRWKYTTGGQVLSSAVFFDGGMLIGSDDGYLYCFDPYDGTLNWRYRTEGEVQTTPLILEGRAYFGSFDRNLTCILLPEPGSRDDPEMLWRFSTSGQIISSAHHSGGGIFFADLDGYVYRVDLEGKEVWRSRPTTREIWATPALDENGGRLYVGDINGGLYALDMDGGSVLASIQLPGDSEIYSSALLSQGSLFLTTGEGRSLVRLDLSNFSTVWSFNTGHATYSSPVIRDKRIYFGSFEYAWCVPAEDPSGDGEITQDELFWSAPTYDFQGGSSPLVTADRVYIGSDASQPENTENLYCFNSSTGELIWKFDTDGYVYSSPALYNGSIYFGSADRKVYCVGERIPGISVTVEAERDEITSDEGTYVNFSVVDQDGFPITDPIVEVSPSSGEVSGVTKLGGGNFSLFFQPPEVSSRSTVEISVSVRFEGLRDGRGLVQIAVEPGESSGEGGSPRVLDVNSERLPYLGAIGALVLLNLILMLISFSFYMGSRVPVDGGGGDRS